MMTKLNRGDDIVGDFRLARSRLRLGRYEKYLVEHITHRVSLLLGKCDGAADAGIDQGEGHEPGERAVAFGRSLARTARARG
jgi:hypothetical protein